MRPGQQAAEIVGGIEEVGIGAEPMTGPGEPGLQQRCGSGETKNGTPSETASNPINQKTGV